MHVHTCNTDMYVHVHVLGTQFCYMHLQCITFSESLKAFPRHVTDIYTRLRLLSLPLQGGHEQLLKPPVTKCDTGTQTDTHFMESNIVKSYEWNEWELRRKAIKLVPAVHRAPVASTQLVYTYIYKYVASGVPSA